MKDKTGWIIKIGGCSQGTGDLIEGWDGF